MRILASDGIEKGAAKRLAEAGHEVVQQFYEPAELAEQVKHFDVLVVRSATKVRKPTIDAACETGMLKLIIRGGVGIDNIDHEYAQSNGIKVMNTPRASSDSVAELALAHMLSVARFINISGHTMREGKWEKKAYKGIELGGKTLGIIGYGRIGQALGRRAQALGMKVVAFDIFKIPELENENMRYADLDTLFAASDFISLHTPSIDGKPLINADTIAQMKDGVVIINTSRGNNVDEAALLDALNSGKVYGAGLDVFAEEPAKNAALYSHPRVSCTPHIGASTSEAQKRIGAEIVDIITSFA
ncbi:MAG: D-2-hydroxyacid dehydrogenase [Clostridia bacterium]|nr:D-2-hydroxyacid dehydrogenase [Clostridia bacterium]